MTLMVNAKWTMLPKASDIYTIRMPTQPMAGGIIVSCDPVGRPKVVDAKASLKPEWRKLLVKGAQTELS